MSDERMTFSFDIDPALFSIGNDIPAPDDVMNIVLPVGLGINGVAVRDVEIVPIAGHAESKLSSPGLAKRGTNVANYLAHIIRRIGTTENLNTKKPDKNFINLMQRLCLADRSYIYLMARIFSLGEAQGYTWKEAPLTCPRCRAIVMATVDLKEMLYGNIISPTLQRVPESDEEVRTLFNEARAAFKGNNLDRIRDLDALFNDFEADGEEKVFPHYVPAHVPDEVIAKNKWEVTLPQSQAKVKYRLLNGTDEQTISEIMNIGAGDEASEILMRGVLSINGHAPRVSELSDLSALDIRVLLFHIEFGCPGGKLDTSLIMDCPKCGAKDQKVEVPFQDPTFLDRF